VLAEVEDIDTVEDAVRGRQGPCLRVRSVESEHEIESTLFQLDAGR
jgi:hypothetical protein